AAPTFTTANTVTGGALVFSLVVTDATGLASAADTVTITITAANDAPVFTSSGTTSATEDSAYSYSITATDADSSAITLACTAGCTSSWLSLADAGSGSGTLTGTPGDANVGTTAVTITATDGEGGVGTQSFNIVVANINDIGSVDMSGTFTEDQVITATVTDADNDGTSDTYTYQWASSSDLSSWSNIGTSSTYTLTQSDVGKYIRISVSYTDDDGTVESHSDTHLTVVANLNDAGTGLSLISDGTVSDPDQGDTLSVSGTLADDDGCTGNTCALAYVWNRDGSAISSETSSSYTLVEADVGTIISVVMTYTDDLSSSNTYTLTADSDVDNVNDAPTAEAGPAQTVAEAVEVTLAGSGTDPESESLTYAWTQASGTTQTLSSATAAAPTFTTANTLTGGALVFSLVVTDATGLASAADTVTITITAANDAPTAEAGPAQTVAETVEVTLAGSGSDPEGESMTYAWTQSSGTTQTLSDATAAAPTFTTANTLTGSALVFSLVVTDASGLASAADTVTITITAANDAPIVASAISDASTAEDAAYSLDASGTCTDADASDTMVYSISGGPSTITTTDAGVISGTPVNADVDAHTITVTCTDAAGSSATDSYILTVTNTNDAPTYSSADNAPDISEGSTDIEIITVSDEDASESFTCSLGGADAASFGCLVSGDDVGIAFLIAPDYDVAGDADSDNDYLVTLTINDGDDDGPTISYTISVTDTNDQAPTYSGGDVTPSVAEGTTAVDSFTVVDTDSGDVNTCSLGGADAASFACSVSSDSISIAFATAPDYESPGSAAGTNVYAMTATINDGVNTGSALSYTVTVTDATEIIILAGQTGSVAEDASAGDSVMTVTITDSTPTAILFSAGNGDGIFAIATSGAVTIADATNLDYETTASYTLTIVAYDATSSDVESITISITNVNDAPTLATAQADASTAEDSLYTLDVSGNFADADS
ncbi:MAG: hypothetical protein HOL71_04205, partial [Euryarchaeota archaeon]|nr:hypothetical protein [Euryarchaeota archaeon]